LNTRQACAVELKQKLRGVAVERRKELPENKRRIRAIQEVNKS